MGITRVTGVLILAWATQGSSAEGPEGPPKQTQPAVDQDYAVQGEYVGEIAWRDDGSRGRVGVQIVALGRGEFLAVCYVGGLPGAGWDKRETRGFPGKRVGDTVQFEGDRLVARVHDGVLDVGAVGGRSWGTLKRIVRESPTLGKKPPQGAVVLFDGTTADAFVKGRMTPDGLLMQGATSKQRIGSCHLHIEFRLPYEPQDRGQDRGNSGIFLQGRYEVQMLDSFGLEGKNNECGAIYGVKAPDLNMCLPPLQWQTYDIDFRQARYDGKRMTATPRISVRHNGMLIHEDVELPGGRVTSGAILDPGPEPGPVFLQEIGNPVRYRNVWLLPKD